MIFNNKLLAGLNFLPTTLVFALLAFFSTAFLDKENVGVILSIGIVIGLIASTLLFKAPFLFNKYLGLFYGWLLLNTLAREVVSGLIVNIAQAFSPESVANPWTYLFHWDAQLAVIMYGIYAVLLAFVLAALALLFSHKKLNPSVAIFLFYSLFPTISYFKPSCFGQCDSEGFWVMTPVILAANPIYLFASLLMLHTLRKLWIWNRKLPK